MVEIVVSIIMGAISGWLASIIMHTKSGLIKNIILGIVGGIVGKFVFGLLNISFGGILGIIVVSVVGACILIFIAKLIAK